MTILNDIVTVRRGDLPGIAHQLRQCGITDENDLTVSQRSLYDALVQPGPLRAVMECKAASPSLGVIATNFDPVALARVYSSHSAAISVLCEPHRFAGSYAHLAAVAATSHLPVLCKDFIVDRVQLLAARYYGADAALLMLSVLSDAEYAELAGVADRLGLDVLTEVASESELQRSVELGAKIIGINHRDLHDLSIDLDRSGRLAPLVPEGTAVIAESGLGSRAELGLVGPRVHGVLVGSSLSGAADPDARVRELCYGLTKVCGLTDVDSALVAAAAGASFGGLIRVPTSPRFVTAGQAHQIMAEVPRLRYVMVTTKTDPTQIARQAAELPGLHAVQLHAAPANDTELATRLRDLLPAKVALWRAVDMLNTPTSSQFAELGRCYDRLVLDRGPGGTGTTFDWSALSAVPAEVRAKALLAGGLSAANAAAALATGAAGLDFNSGLETSPGSKDPARIRDALAACLPANLTTRCKDH